ncbi:MAG: hypothetical protein GC185_11005 [Alphaproteobacteria bacterium]|nr:hypothetical protein [Alphaproteobacteria bacterium]
MNRKIRSLVAAFTIATAGMTGLCATANAQSVPVYPQPSTVQAATTANYVSQQAINDVAYNIGVQDAYYGAGLGFTDAYASTGEHIGLAFTLDGSRATITRAYNMNNGAAAQQFYAERQNAANIDARVAANQNSGYYNGTPNYQLTRSYEVIPPVVAAVGIGWIIHDIADHGHHDGNRRIIQPPRRDYRGYDNDRHEKPRFDKPRYEKPRQQQQHFKPAPRQKGGGHHR